MFSTNRIQLDEIASLSLYRVGGRSLEEDVWDFNCFVDTARDVFEYPVALSNLYDINNHTYLRYKNQLMRMCTNGNLYLVRETLEGGPLVAPITLNIGVVAIVPHAAIHRGKEYTYLKYFGFVKEMRGKKYGSKIMKIILESYPDILTHVEYPNSDEQDKVVEFYANCGFDNRYTIKTENGGKHYLMSTDRLVTLDEYVEHEYELSHLYLRDLEDKLQTI